MREECDKKALNIIWDIELYDCWRADFITWSTFSHTSRAYRNSQMEVWPLSMASIHQSLEPTGQSLLSPDNRLWPLPQPRSDSLRYYSLLLQLQLSFLGSILNRFKYFVAISTNPIKQQHNKIVSFFKWYFIHLLIKQRFVKKCVQYEQRKGCTIIDYLGKRIFAIL